MAQSVERQTWAQVMISRLVGSSPTSGSVRTARSLEPASDSVSSSLSAPPLLSLSLSKISKHLKKKTGEGHLGGSVDQASDFGSGHDLTACGFEPHIGLCADSSEPGACFGSCVSLSLCASPARALCLSLKNK